jgi:CheY-like chemotaxis protein
VSVLVLVVDDEPDVEALFRQQFRRDLRAQRFVMDFANSAAEALARIAGTIEQSLILILSDINMPGMSGLEMLPRARSDAARCSRHHDYRLWRSRDQAQGDRKRRERLVDQADRLCVAEERNRHAARTGCVTSGRTELPWDAFPIGVPR